jgi:CheY-like chemotaxis protein
MPRHLLPERLTHLRADAQLLVAQSGEHQDQLAKLEASAERDLHQAETIAQNITIEDVEQVRHLLRSHLRRSVAAAAMTRQLSTSAREQHAAASRLLADLDDDDFAGECPANAVLVVDDYGDVRELVAGVLQNAGFVVRTAANGLEGLIAAYQMRPGVILMDVTMPVLDGIEATRLIKASEVTRHARVIAYTANPSLDSTLVQTLFSAVLQKPATPAVVLATVQHVASL